MLQLLELVSSNESGVAQGNVSGRFLLRLWILIRVKVMLRVERLYVSAHEF